MDFILFLLPIVCSAYIGYVAVVKPVLMPHPTIIGKQALTGHGKGILAASILIIASSAGKYCYDDHKDGLKQIQYNEKSHRDSTRMVALQSDINNLKHQVADCDTAKMQARVFNIEWNSYKNKWEKTTNDKAVDTKRPHLYFPTALEGITNFGLREDKRKLHLLLQNSGDECANDIRAKVIAVKEVGNEFVIDSRILDRVISRTATLCPIIDEALDLGDLFTVKSPREGVELYFYIQVKYKDELGKECRPITTIVRIFPQTEAGSVSFPSYKDEQMIEKLISKSNLVD